MEHGRSANGFTLIEVVVALLVLSGGGDDSPFVYNIF